jgi:ankyrin repeat protein
LLLRAIDENNLLMCQYICDSHKEEPDQLDQPDEENRTPVMRAVRLGRREIVNMLLRYVDLSKTDEVGRTVLHDSVIKLRPDRLDRIAREIHFNILEDIVMSNRLVKDTVNLRDESGWPAIYYCIDSGGCTEIQQRAAKLLLGTTDATGREGLGDVLREAITKKDKYIISLLRENNIESK